VYCSDSSTCEVCKDPYYYLCEDLSDEDRKTAKSWGITLIVFTLLLAVSGIYQYKVNVDFWIIVNAI